MSPLRVMKLHKEGFEREALGPWRGNGFWRSRSYTHAFGMWMLTRPDYVGSLMFGALCHHFVL